MPTDIMTSLVSAASTPLVFLLLLLLLPLDRSALSEAVPVRVEHPDVVDLAKELATIVADNANTTFTVEGFASFLEHDLALRARLPDIERPLIRHCEYDGLGDEAEELADLLAFDADEDDMFHKYFAMRVNPTAPIAPPVLAYLNFMENHRGCADIAAAVTLRLCAQQHVIEAVRHHLADQRVVHTAGERALLERFVAYHNEADTHNGGHSCTWAHRIAERYRRERNTYGLVEAALGHELALWGLERPHNATCAPEDKGVHHAHGSHDLPPHQRPYYLRHRVAAAPDPHPMLHRDTPRPLEDRRKVEQEHAEHHREFVPTSAAAEDTAEDGDM